MGEVYVEGTDHFNQTELKHAMNFFLSQQMTQEERKKITVFIKLVPKKELPPQTMAVCEWLDDNVEPKEFRIRVSKSMSKKGIIKTLAHESVHVDQMFRGRLVDLRNDQLVFMKKDYRLSLIDYGDQPWETEAIFQEGALNTAYYIYREMNPL